MPTEIGRQSPFAPGRHPGPRFRPTRRAYEPAPHVPNYPPTPPSEEDLANALSGRYGSVALRYRFYHADNLNIPQADITEAFVARECSITLTNDRAVVRTATFVIRPSLMPEDFDYLESNVAVFVDVKILQQWWRFQLGLFRLDEPEETLGFADDDVSRINASDLTVLLMQPSVGESYTVVEGTTYTIAVANVLDILGLRYLLPGTTLQTPRDFTWQPKTSYLAIINELLAGINFFDIWPDVYGVFTTRERVAPVSDTPAVAYRTDQEPRMIRPGLRRRKTSVRPPNRVIAAIKDPIRDPAAGIAENVDVDSPSSTANVEVSAQEFNVDRIVNVATATDWAAYTVRVLTGKGQTANLTTHFDPRRDAHEVYLLTYYDHEVETTWRVAGWTFNLYAGAPMIHLLERALTLAVATTEVTP